MTAGRASLNAVIAVEAAALLLLAGLLIAILPSLREEKPRGRNSEVPPPAPPPQAALAPPPPPAPADVGAGGYHLFPPPSLDLPVSGLRSHRLVQGLQSAPAAGGDFVPSTPATLKIEPQGETRWNRGRAGGEGGAPLPAGGNGHVPI